MAYVALKSRELRVGLYVRLGHTWSEHPFLRNAFKIKSLREIAMIRKHGLSKLYYNPDRSDPEAVKQVQSQPSQTEDKGAEEEIVLTQEESKEEELLMSMKEARTKAFVKRRESLKKTEKIYNKVIREGKNMIKKVSAGHVEGLEMADAIIESIINVLNSGAAETSVINQVQEMSATNISFMHALNVCILSMSVAQEFGLERNQMHMLGLGALFHDAGKQQLPAQLRSKKDNLNQAELYYMKMHPQYGKEMVQASQNFPIPSIDVIYQHHERIDGSGYPDGLTGDDITLMSKIVSVINEYDNMTSGSSEKSHTPTVVLGHFYKNMQKVFSPEVIVSLIQAVTVYPPGSLVRLNDGSIGMVIRINHQDRMKPMIMVHEPEISREDAIIVDLAEDTDFSIQESLSPNNVSRETMKYLNPGNMSGYFISEST
jgi:HD-GYP domain-containing protein (c-di-GMP phosphodiesterase class II)